MEVKLKVNWLRKLLALYFHLLKNPKKTLRHLSLKACGFQSIPVDFLVFVVGNVAHGYMSMRFFVAIAMNNLLTTHLT